MKYILTHRKTPVVEIVIDEETAVISKIGTVFAPEHIPIGVSFKDKIPNRGDLNDWWNGRSIPASRQNIREAIAKLGISSTKKLIMKCFGLSLSDQYWVNPVDNPLEWEKINFFDKPFSEDMGNILFNEAIGDKLNLMSPDNTSDGWLKKKWKIVGKKRCLIKGGSDPFHQQPLNEVMASIVMERIDIPHVPYSVIWDDGFPYSICENFVTSETELISAYYIHITKKIEDINHLYDHYLDCCSGLGISNSQIHVDKMLVVDYLIANNDRHFGNFGAVRNAVTLEWVAPAPLYDNGSSFWYNQNTKNILNTNETKSQPFFHTHEKQIGLVRDFSWLDFSKLIGIDEEFNELLLKSPFIDVERRDILCFALRRRLEMLMDIMGQ